LEEIQPVTAEQYPPRFHSRAPLWGGDLQTLRNMLVPNRSDLSGTYGRVYFTLEDGSGDRLAAMLHRPVGPANGPLVVLVHGLTGSEDSAYIRASTAFHLKRKRRVLRLNLRGAGPSRQTCSGHYHGGSAPDIRDALTALDRELMSEGLFLVGFSLGGNLLINLLANHAGGLPIRGATTVSAPIDPAQAALRLMAPRNAVYHAWLLHLMKRGSTAPGARLSGTERAIILRARTIFEYDDTSTAPRNGFSDAHDYYANTAGARVVQDVRVPTLMIHASNDPWVPADPYKVLEARNLPNIRVILSPGGGHVGFHANDEIETWHDRCTDVFLGSL
jgi:predicted alpha/beta-fold hydrolase